MKVKDHFLTQEFFELKENSFGILETFPKPKEADLSKYYESNLYISHTDSKKSLFDRIYQIAKKYNLDNKKKHVLKYKKGGKLLDYGCGTGDFLNHIKNDFEGQGIEPNNTACKIAKDKTKLIITSYTDLTPIQNNTFDVITLWHVLEHVYDLENISKELKRILKEDGLLVIAVPNYKSKDAEYYKEHWAAYDVPRHLWHFSKKSMVSWWDKKNMKIINISPMRLDSYYVSILSEKYRNKNYFSFIRGFYHGLQSNFKAKRTGEYSSLIYFFKNTD